jgi:hypothetical protein
MTYANNTPGTQTITFNVPGASAASPGEISLGGTAMPSITESVVIDATTQPGYDGKPVIELAGNNNVSNGFETAPDVAGVTIKGFAITTFSGFGVALAQAENQAGDVVQQNYIGTDRFGSAGKGNGSGMRVRADASSVVNNVISGNQSTGVLLDNDANNVTVASNQIGTMADSLTGRANGGDGIALDHSSHDNTIISNTIALNGAWGINALHSLAAAVSGTQIRSNYIGTNASGAALGNGSGGIRLDSTPATQIGGTSGAGNTIAFNTGSGIVALGATQARIQENSIYSNSVLGIDLNGDGVTANDGPADSDSGPNGLQNFVTMLSASTTGSQNTVVSFDANQLNPGNLFTVEFFAGGACHTVGYGEGMAFAGSTVVTGGSGNAQFTIGLSVAAGQIITATVSDSAGNTSEFSNCVTVQAAPPQITSVEPAAFAAGQMITINGANFSAQNLADVVIRQASSEVAVSYLWMSSPTKIIARTSPGVATGPAQVVVKTNQTTPESALNVTIQTQEGAPNFMHMRNGNCGGFGGPGDTSQAWSGGDLYLVASGIDTNGVEAVFTPQTGGAAVVVQAYLACGFPGGGDIAAQVQVPALPLGNYNVTMRSNSVGHESVDSNAKPLQIVSIFVNAVSGGQANSNGPGGPFPPQTIGTIKNGQQVVFSASGTAQYNGTSTSGPAGTAGACGPSCLAPALNAHALIGRFNGGAWFLIGAGTTVTNSNGQGWLELAMNDDDYSDNAGGWTVIVSPQ